MDAAGLKVFQTLEEGGGTNVPARKKTWVGHSVRFVAVGGRRGTSVRLSSLAWQPNPGDLVESKMRQVPACDRKSLRSYKIKARSSRGKKGGGVLYSLILRCSPLCRFITILIN